MSADSLELFDPAQFPYVVEVVTEVSRTGRVEHFEFGLDLILDGLERTLEQEASAAPRRKIHR